MRPPVARDAGAFALLLISPVLSLLRITAVAAFVSIPDFALYSASVAVGSFLSTLLSFGLIERTIQLFPRLVHDGKADILAREALDIAGKLLLRAAVVTAGLVAAAVAFAPDQTLLAAITGGIALGVSWFALLASIQRGFVNPQRLARGTFLRAAITAGLVSLAATGGVLYWVLIAEVGSMLLGCVLTWAVFFRHLRPAARGVVAGAAAGSGLIVFAAQSSAAAPFYLDRAYVTSILPGFAAGQYAVLALGILAGSLLVSTVVQKTGPETIVLAHRGEIALARRHAWRWMSLTAACWSLAMGAAWVVVAAGWVPAAYARYGITPAMLLPVWLIGLLLNSGKLEFLVLALDREWRLLRAALLFLGAVLIGAALIAWQGGTIMAVLWGLVAARAVYFAALWHASRPGAEAERRLDAGAVEALAAGPTDPAAPASAAGPGERAG